MSGVAATISETTMPTISSGQGDHVAAWVGVGGPGMGPGGTDEWLQVGLASFDGPAGRLYFELALPHKQPKFNELASGIKPGQQVRVAVMELPYAPNEWIVITPKGIAGPFDLPGSHGKWAPTMTGESWAHGGSLCNDYSYRFDGVQTADKNGWRTIRHSATLEDHGWKVQRISPSAFSASNAQTS